MMFKIRQCASRIPDNSRFQGKSRRWYADSGANLAATDNIMASRRQLTSNTTTYKTYGNAAENEALWLCESDPLQYAYPYDIIGN